MGSATSSIPSEPIVAAAAVAGALGYGYVHYYFRAAAHSGDEDAYSDANAGVGASNAPSTLRGPKKRGRKLQLPGDATLKNLDVLDAPVVPGSLSVSTSASSKMRERQRQAVPQPRQEQREREAPTAAAQAQPRDVVPGGFDGTVASAREQPQPSLEQVQVQVQQQQQHVSVGTTKKPKKKKGKKATAATSDPSSASALGAPHSLATSTEGVVGKGKKATASASVAADAEDAHDERWTRVEARKKKAPVQPQDGLAETSEATAADVTTSDAGITTSVTGNSSPVTERTTEDELRSDLDECASLFLCFLTPPAVLYLICAHVTFVGVRWRSLRRHFRVQHLTSYPYARHQARSPRRDFRGRIMKVCMLLKTRRARKMVVGASSEAAAVSSSFSPCFLNLSD
jgi:hypothetical protein